MLSKGLAIGFVPGFISDHSYMQAPGNESDANLLLRSVAAPGRGRALPHGVPAGLVLPVIVTAREREVCFDPNDVAADLCIEDRDAVAVLQPADGARLALEARDRVRR